MGRSMVVGAAALVFVCACGSPELKLGSNIGLVPMRGDTRTTLDPRACPGECRIWFARDVSITTERELASLADYIKALDLEVKVLSFEDDDTGAIIEMDEQVKSGSITIAKQTLTNVELASLPHTVRIEGEELESLRDQLVAHQFALLNVTADLVIGPPLPQRLLVRYWVQPVLIIGAQE